MAIEKIFIQIIISNPSKWPRTELISARFKNSLNTHALQIYDSENFEITSQIELDKDDFYKIKFVAENVPPLGKKEYYIKKRDPRAEFHLPEQGLLDGNDYYIENDAVRIVIEENGLITIMDRIDDEIDSKCDKKVTIMGEELGCGSIWAGDSFFNYQNLHKFEIQPENEFNSEIDYSLIEANDFRGTLQLNRTLKKGNNLPIRIKTSIVLEKGNNSVIKFKTTVQNLPDELNLTLLFPLKLSTEKLQNIHDLGIYSLFDNEQQRGLALFTDLNDFKLISGKNKTTLSISLPNNGDISTYEYAILPLKSPLNEYSLRLGEEYKKPLNWEIIY